MRSLPKSERTQACKGQRKRAIYITSVLSFKMWVNPWPLSGFSKRKDRRLKSSGTMRIAGETSRMPLRTDVTQVHL